MGYRALETSWRSRGTISFPSPPYVAPITLNPLPFTPFPNCRPSTGFIPLFRSSIGTEGLKET